MLTTKINRFSLRLLVFVVLSVVSTGKVGSQFIFLSPIQTAYAQSTIPPLHDISTVDNTSQLVTTPVNSWQQVADVTFPLLNHPAAQEFPAIDNQRVVWQDGRTGPADIFLADLTANTLTNLTDSAAWEANPDIDGDIVVWRDGYQGIGIHGMALSSGQIFTVTTGNSDVNAPRISGGYVVWAAKQPGAENWVVYGFDVTTAQKIVISDKPGLAPTVNIDGNLVVWTSYSGTLYLYNRDTGQTREFLQVNQAENPDVSVADQMIVWQDRRNGNFDIYGWDLATDQERPLVTDIAHQAAPRIAHGLVAFQSQILIDSWNVHLLVLANNQSFPLTDNSNRQAMAVTDGEVVVWEDSRNHQNDIYGFTWKNEVPPSIPYTIEPPMPLQVGALPGGSIVLHWQPSTSSVDGYEIERTEGIIGLDWKPLAKLSASSTEYTDIPPTMGESYWYRVRALKGGEFSRYGNESFSSTFASVPSLDEQYLMVLINEFRADPAKFNHPEAKAVPPVAYNPLLGYAARAQSQSILNSGYQFGHCDPSGRCSTERAQAVGYTGGGCSDNLFTVDPGYTAMENANQAFWESEGHRHTMLEPGFTEMGMGHTYDLQKGIGNRHGQISEIFCGRTDAVIPAIPVGAVIPYSGTAVDTYTYVANYYAKDGISPSKTQVVIDGVAHDLQLSTGAAANGTYRLQTKLGKGEHEYYFLFESAGNQQFRWPEVGVMNYPQVLSGDVPEDIVVEPTACEATITWRTQGKSTSQLDYGTTVAYDQTRIVSDLPIDVHQVKLSGLLPNQVYHFRIRSVGEGSGEFASDDQSFSTRDPLVVPITSPEQNLQQVLNNTPACDMILVAPGTYTIKDTLQIPDGISLVGTDPNQTILQSTGDNVVILHGKSTLSGFTISGANLGAWGSGVAIANDSSPLISGNHITGNLMGISAYCASDGCVSHAHIQNNLITQNSDGGIVDTVGGNRIVNNTVVNNKDGIRVDAKNESSIVKNNIIAQNQNAGLLQTTMQIFASYNNLWANAQDYVNLSPASGDISADPLFVDAQAGNYHLVPASPSVDTGDPDARYLDDNQSRNDMGAYGGTTGNGRVELTVTANNFNPQPDSEIRFEIKVMNPVVASKEISVMVTIPQQVTFLEGRINDSNERVILDGDTLIFKDVALPFRVAVLLSFRVRANHDLGTQAIPLNFPIKAQWNGILQQSEAELIVNGFAVYLPMIAR